MKAISRFRWFVVCACLFFSSAPVLAAEAAEKPAEVFSDEIEKILSVKTSELQALLQDPGVLDAVRAANLERGGLTMDEILAADKKFRAASPSDPWIQGFMTNACAQLLILYQKEHSGYAEIFIADSKGLNVSQTNKTSDYYQADEDWWVQTYMNGAGKVHHGDIEFDESSQSQAVSLYAPIMDGSPPRAIGVAKAVLDISQITDEL